MARGKDEKTLRDVVRAHHKFKGNISAISKELGISRSTIYSYLEEPDAKSALAEFDIADKTNYKQDKDNKLSSISIIKLIEDYNDLHERLLASDMKDKDLFAQEKSIMDSKKDLLYKFGAELQGQIEKIAVLKTTDLAKLFTEIVSDFLGKPALINTLKELLGVK